MTKLIFIADTHHFSKTLSAGGRAYELRSGSDQKCLMETGAIIDSAFDKLKDSDADAILIAGDVSNDGERVSHEEFREKLYELKKHKKVYLITATHDWCCDENPRRYEGNAVYHDVETVPSTELRDFYKDFGPSQANAEFITHLGVCSYTVDVGEDVRILALNDDQNGRGRAGFTEDHFQWIEEQIKKAEADGKFLIGMEHHLLIAHVHPLITGGGTCVGDREIVASRLADAGLRYMFVGHSHMQAVDKFVSPAGNPITEVNIGSLVGYPAPMISAVVDDGKIHVTTEYLDKFEYEGRTYDAQKFLKKHACALVDRVLECAKADKHEFGDRIEALQIEGKALDNLEKLFPVIKPVLKLVVGLDAHKCWKILSALHLVPKELKADFESFEDKPVTDFIHEVMLSFMDGQIVRYKESDSYYKVVMSVVAIPKKFKSCKLTNDLYDCAKAILLGNEYNINDCTI